MRTCKKCRADISSQRRNAKQCPDCRALQILRWCLERKRARRCVKCGDLYRSSGEYDLSYCVKCAAESDSPAVAGLFRGTVTRCDVCAERGETWWAATDPERHDLEATAATTRANIARGVNLRRNEPLLKDLEARLGAWPQPRRLAFDHRVPLCAACAKHPEYQGQAVAWLERRIRDKLAAAGHTA